MTIILGIDLGTTNSVAAVMGEDGPRLIPNALGEMLTPSVVGFDKDDGLLVGRAAKELRVTHPERCATLFKRHMGSQHKVNLAGNEMTPEMLSALVIRTLKEDAEAFLGESITAAVITVPAYFNDNQRKATIQAGQIAGLEVKRIVNEPTAAAMAYGLHESEEDRLMLVVDLGGGTFDVSVVEVFDGTLEIRASSGESFLGGEDFTSGVAARLMLEQGIAYEHAEINAPKQVSRMLQLCEVAKRRLTAEQSVEVRVPDTEGALSESSPQVSLTREQFHNWTEPILARIEPPIRRALGDAKIKRRDIQEVILVGGATRMPRVVQRVADLFDRAPHSKLNPDEVVALGAAVQAGLIAGDQALEEMVVTDVCPFTLGIEISRQIGNVDRNGYFMPIINRNTTIPVSRVERVQTMRANQSEVLVTIFQGESRHVKDNLKLGDFSVRGIPMGPAGQEVDVRFTYDMNGILEVEATIVKTGKKIQHLITRYVEGLSQQQVSGAVEQMQALKIHPREEAVNRTLLRRAERLYAELSLYEREEISDLLDGFETALEMGEKQAIEEFRLALDLLLSRLEGASDEDNPDEDTHERW